MGAATDRVKREQKIGRCAWRPAAGSGPDDADRLQRIVFDCAAYLHSYRDVLRCLDTESVSVVAEQVCSTWRLGGTVFLCGNGGSAASASHLATDLVKLTACPGVPRLRAVALGESVSWITAVSNDVAFEEVFVEQLRAFLGPSDLVIGLSTSGSSRNVLRAIDYARENGAATIGITGGGGAALQHRAAYTVVVPSRSVQQIEDATMVLGHLVCLTVATSIAAMSHPRDAEGQAVPSPP